MCVSVRMDWHASRDLPFVASETDRIFSELASDAPLAVRPARVAAASPLPIVRRAMGRGYRDGDAPWRFSGRALYQLNLVKSSEARKHVPKDLKLVELFGYTLGGVYLARYEDSPAGTFDEMVALGGLVWNPPTSCAWAARVFVNDAGARAHGVKTCGLPSALARFDDDDDDARRGKTHGWWKNVKPPSVFAKVRAFARGERAVCKEKKRASRSETVRLRDGDTGADVCSLALPGAGAGPLGPRINVKLPSFSGRTEACPDLLKYSLDLRANVRLSGPILADTEAETETAQTAAEATTSPAGAAPSAGFWAPTGDVRFPPALAAASAASLSLAQSPVGQDPVASEVPGKPPRRSPQPPADAELAAILRGKPLLCVAFDAMEMDVGAPVKV